MQPFLQVVPPLNPAVLRFYKHDPAVREYLRHASPGVLPAVPHIRRRYVLIRRIAALHSLYIIKRLGYNLAALIYLSVCIGVSHAVHGYPVPRQHIKAIVHGKIPSPLLRYLKRLHNVQIAPPLGKVGSVVYIPKPQTQLFILVLRQISQTHRIFRVFFHKPFVALQIRRNKYSCRIFCLERLVLYSRVDKPCLYKSMPHSAGVRAALYMLRVSVRTANSRNHVKVHIFRKMRQLVEPYNVVLRALVPVNVTFAVAIAKVYNTSVAKRPHMRSGIVLCKLPRVHFLRCANYTLLQLGERSSQNKLPRMRICKPVYKRVLALHIAFAASGFPAVKHFKRVRFAKKPLRLALFPLYNRHSSVLKSFPAPCSSRAQTFSSVLKPCSPCSRTTVISSFAFSAVLKSASIFSLSIPWCFIKSSRHFAAVFPSN